MSAPRRAPGRPLDRTLDTRFIAAGGELIAGRGLHRVNVDVLAQHLHAGKAAFYRRWTDVDHFLVDVALALAAQPVPYPEPRTPSTDLVALVLHQVNGDRGAVLTALLGRLPYSPPLRDAWILTGGPFLAQSRAIADVVTHLGIAGTDAAAQLHVGVEKLIAHQREQRLLLGDNGVHAAIVKRQVQELLDDLDGDPDTCARCGCTDEEACPDGCFWIAPRLCSACATPPELEAHATEPITLVEP